MKKKICYLILSELSLLRVCTLENIWKLISEYVCVVWTQQYFYPDFWVGLCIQFLLWMVVPCSILNIHEDYTKKCRQIVMSYCNRLYKTLLKTKIQELLLYYSVTGLLTKNTTSKWLLKIVVWCIPSVGSWLARIFCLI